MANVGCTLGLDLSTQQVKMVLIDGELNVLHEVNVQFDKDLPEFKTEGGVHIHEDELTVTSPVLMWLKALDLALHHLKNSGRDLAKIQAISGSAQQHGSVYWKHGARYLLNNMKGSHLFHQALQQDSFSVLDSPVWMDSSTTAECHHLEAEVGGAQKMASLTGSRAYERVSLISSFAASLFLGDYAEIDFSDGSGMNLLDINNREWAPTCLDACAPRLAKKLGNPVPSHTILGYLSPYLVERYGFSPNCQVIAFTGDNPASLAGMRLEEGDMVVSLGTSDTVFLWLERPRPALEGHVFIHPMSWQAYMGLICSKNGSLARERVCAECADGSWEQFSKLLKETVPGNKGNIGFYYFSVEITPPAIGIHRFNAQDEKISEFSRTVEIRSLIEGQFLSKRIHAEKLGYCLLPQSRILATGGASCNADILQVLADVFDVPVYTLETTNSACLGAAYQARFGLLSGEGMSFHDIVSTAAPHKLSAKPNPAAVQTYNAMLERFCALEEKVVEESLR
uniref:xylulose kinase isoform X4 n=1 Tax=Myxine glutinosa TaxID=7769 RepID=UPI00359024EB